MGNESSKKSDPKSTNNGSSTSKTAQTATRPDSKAANNGFSTLTRTQAAIRSDSKTTNNGSTTTTRTQTNARPDIVSGFSMDLIEKKQKVIDFIRQRVDQKGLKEFYAFEVLEAVLPDAYYTFDQNKCIFSWKHYSFSAESTNQLIAKRKAAAAAMKQLFEISLPVYERPNDETLYQKYEQYFEYVFLPHKAQWKASFSYEDKSFQVYRESKTLAKELLWNDQTKRVLYEIDSRPIKDSCIEALIASVISISDPLEKRVEFILKHLVSSKDESFTLKPTEGVLTSDERLSFEELHNKMRYFTVCVPTSDVEHNLAGLIVNKTIMFRAKRSLIEAKISLISSAMSVISREYFFQTLIEKVDDDTIESSYWSSDGRKTLDQIKQIALENARTLLETNSLENDVAMWILKKSLQYVNYCEDVLPSKIVSTILWKDQKFVGIDPDKRVATMEASAKAVNTLLNLPLKHCSFSDKEEKRQTLRRQVKYSFVGNDYKWCINLDGHIIEVSAESHQDGNNLAVEKALDHIFSERVKETARQNKEMLVRALVKKDEPLIGRVKCVVRYLRADDDTLFKCTDNILTESERNRLLTIEKSIKIEEKSNQFIATVDINDTILSEASIEKIEAKNAVILAAFSFLESLNVGNGTQSRSKSPEAATAVPIKKDDSLVNRIKFVVHFLRTDDTKLFKCTDDILTKIERSRLLTIEKNIKIEKKAGKFIASVDINDNILSEASSEKIDAKNAVIVAAYLFLENLNVAKCTEPRSKSPKGAPLIKKGEPLLDRIKFVVRCLRTDDDTFFKCTDNILIESERNRLLTIEKSIKIEGKPGKFIATVNINDNILSEASNEEVNAKNAVIIAAFSFLENINAGDGSQSRSKSPEGATAVPIVTNPTSEPLTDPPKLFESIPNSILQYPSKVWHKITKDKFPIETTKIDPFEFISSIVYDGKLFKETSFNSEESRHKVACTAMRQLWGLNSEFWDDYFKSIIGDMQMQVRHIGKERRDAIALYKKSAQDYFHELQLNSIELQPQNFWDFGTAGKFPITTSHSPIGYTSTIQFFGERFSSTDPNEVESRQKVAIIAFDNIFGLRLPYWEEVRLGRLNKTETIRPDQRKKFEKARMQAIQSCCDRTRAIFFSSETKIRNVKPHKFWKTVTNNRHLVETTSTPNGFLSTIDFFGETIRGESRNKVAAIALDKLLDIRLPHWSEYLNTNTANAVAKTPIGKDDNDTNKSKKKTCEASMRLYVVRLNELVSSCDIKTWTPAKLWHALTQPDMPIVTKSVQDGFISTIEFQDKTFTATNKNEVLSRHCVAVKVFDEVFGTCLSHWNHYKNINRNRSRSSSRTSSVNSLVGNQKESTEAKERIEKMDYYSKRAQRLVSSRNKQDRVHPVNLWYSITEQKHPIYTTSNNSKFQCQIRYYGKFFGASDAEEQLSRCKVSVKALSALFGIYYQYWGQYSTPKSDPTASGTEQNASQRKTSVVNSGISSDNRETKIKQMEEKIRACQRSFPEPNPSFFWHEVAGDVIIKSETRNRRTESTINIFGRSYTFGNQNKQASRHGVAAMALCDLFDVNYPHWKEFYPFGKVTPVATNETTDKNPKSEETTVSSDTKVPSSNENRKNKVKVEVNDTEVPSSNENPKTEEKFVSNDTDVPLPKDDEFISPPIKKLSPEEEEAILDKLKSIARDIIEEQEDIDPTDLWNQTVKSYPRYLIKTDYHSKLDKYIATIEFHDKIYTKMNVDQVKAENMVACAALDELIELEFEAEGTDGTENNIDSQLKETKEVKKEQVTVEEVKIETPEPITPEVEEPKEVKTEPFTEDEEDIKTPEPITPVTRELKTSDEEPTRPNCSTQKKDPGPFYEPLFKRVETVLKNVATHFITSSYLIFKHSNVPLLTEKEWNVLKEINANVFSVVMDQSLAETMAGVLKSVIVNGKQLFGGGLTDKEAIHATIVTAFEFIEKQGLEIGVDAIIISKRPVEESDSDDDSPDDEGSDDEETEECSQSTRIQTLKKSLKLMQQKSKNLDNVPCEDIFKTIGIDFKFQFDGGEADPDLARIKEKLGRFAVMKLLDLAYDIDN